MGDQLSAQPKKILTTPRELKENRRVFYTGNHYISLPEISDEDASVQSLNIVSTRQKGLIQLKGDKALFRPTFFRNGCQLHIKSVTASMESYLFPRYVFIFSDESFATVTIYPDKKEKGFIYQVNSSKELEVKIHFQLIELSYLRFNTHPTNFVMDFKEDNWLNNPVLYIQATSGDTPIAMAFGSHTPMSHEIKHNDYVFTFPCNKETAFYVSMNADPDGASTTLVHLKRKGYESIRDEFFHWVQEKEVHYTADQYLQNRLNQNLFFNYFYAVGKDFYYDSYVRMTSRSPRYYVSGAFW